MSSGSEGSDSEEASLLLPAPSSPHAPPLGYTFEGVIGYGSYGTVYLARKVSEPTSLVAVKVSAISPAKLRPEELFCGQFLHHPNIIAVHANITTPSLIYLFSRYVAGKDLHEYTNALLPAHVPERQCSSICKDILRALRYLHNNGVVHRDIKPENILLEPLLGERDPSPTPYRAVLIDFGLCYLLSTAPVDPVDRTAEGQLRRGVGTVGFCAPECLVAVIRSEEELFPTDIYGLGASLYLALVGKCPYSPRSKKRLMDTFADLVRRHPHFPIKALYLRSDIMSDLLARYFCPKFPDHVSPSARYLLSGMLQPQPAKRPNLQDLAIDPWCKLPQRRFQPTVSTPYLSRRLGRRHSI